MVNLRFVGGTLVETLVGFHPRLLGMPIHFLTGCYHVSDRAGDAEALTTFVQQYQDCEMGSVVQCNITQLAIPYNLPVLIVNEMYPCKSCVATSEITDR